MKIWKLPAGVKDRFKGTQTAFLGARSRLTQSWASPAVIVVGLCILKLHLLQMTAEGFLQSAENGAISSCEAANTGYEEVVQLSSESARIVNMLVGKAVTHSVNAVIDSTSTLVTVLEETLKFYVEFTIGTWACLSVSLVNIAANEAINATESVIGVANQTLHSAVDDIEDGLSTLSSIVNDATGLIGTIENFITGSQHQISSINMTVDSLRQIKISPAINSKLESLRQDVPTYDEVKARLENAITHPFELLRSGLTSVNITYHPAAVKSVATPKRSLCQKREIESIVRDCRKAVNTAVRVITGLAAVGLVGAATYGMWTEERLYNRLQKSAFSMSNADSNLLATQNFALLTWAHASGVHRLLLWSFEKMFGRCVKLMWYVQYIFYTPAFSLLFLGVSGLVLALLEYIVVSTLSREAEKLSPAAKSIEKNAIAAIRQSFAEWHKATELEILRTQNDINSHVLGWARTGSLAVNNTLSEFSSSMASSLNRTFGKTPLYKPLSAVVDCVVGNKVQQVEKGLTWIHNKAHVTLPQLPTMRELLGNASITAISTKTGHAEVDFVGVLFSQIKIEAIVAATFVGLWLLFTLGGAIYAKWFYPEYQEKSRESMVFNGPRRVTTFSEHQVQSARANYFSSY